MAQPSNRELIAAVQKLSGCFGHLIQGYRGVVATKDIQADVALVRVARRCCIGPETTDVSKDDWKKAMASAEDATPATDKFGYASKKNNNRESVLFFVPWGGFSFRISQEVLFLPGDYYSST